MTSARALGAGLAALAAAGCESERGVTSGPSGDALIRITEGPCDGDTCPVYQMTLKPDGQYQLIGTRFVRRIGTRFGDLGPDAWARAEATLTTAGFWTAEPVQTAKTRANCQPGAPEVAIFWRTSEGKQKTLTYDAGCGIERTREMVSGLRASLRFEELVWTDRKFNPVTGE
jgi:hypothetical protein